MINAGSTILAVGAAGKFAGLVLPALVQRGARVRGLIRSVADADAVRKHGMEYTLLHPTMFFQNYAGSWSTILKTGALAEPWSNETLFSRVDMALVPLLVADPPILPVY